MRKLAFLALAALGLSQVVGCIIVSDDDQGYFHATWAVYEGYSSPDIATDCGTEGVASVDIRSVDSVGTEWIDRFNCTDYGGTTSALPLDDFVVSAHALDQFDGNLSEWIPIGASLIYAGDTVEVGPFIFLFPPAGPAPGDIAFTVDYGTAVSNCGDTSAGGAAVSSEQVYLSDGTQCINAVLSFDGYSNICGTGQNEACSGCNGLVVCQEKAVAQLLADVPAGNYTLEVVGIPFTGAGCYYGSASVTIDGSVNVGVLSAPHTGDSGLCSFKRAI